jgi:hypothetical protein
MGGLLAAGARDTSPYRNGVLVKTNFINMLKFAFTTNRVGYQTARG